MNNRVCFILGAGLGTRMGKIGKTLPKILWPVFETTLLELQINKAKSLGFEKIYLNTHYCASEIEKYIESNNLDVQCLYEEVLLDSGGAFHNLKRNIDQKYAEDKVFYVNGDILHGLNKSHIEDLYRILDEERVVLVAKDILDSNNYNRIDIENDLLTGITKASDVSPPYQTYAGIGVVNLKRVGSSNTPSKFFDTIADYKKEKVKIYNPGSYEYYDFGTKEEYWKNMFNVFTDTELQELLISLSSVIPEKINIKLNSYYSENENLINLSRQGIGSFTNQAIIMSDTESEDQGPGLYYKNLFDSLDN